MPVVISATKKRCLLALACLGVWSVAAATVPAAGAVPARFWGVVPQSRASAPQLNVLRRGGVDSIRVPLVWEAVQPAPGGFYYWNASDEQIESAAKAGLEVLPYLYSAPPWAVPLGEVPGSAGTSTAPVHLPAYGAAARDWLLFVKAAVTRYGPGGSFWREHPGLPESPLRTWQIWNEENFMYFVLRPDPGEYGRLVKISSRAIERIDPGARIVLGGMFARPAEALSRRHPRRAYAASDFLRAMYRHTPHVSPAFDGVALHPYTSGYRKLAGEIGEVRKVMRRSHDADKGLWLTELGWSSQPPVGDDSFAKGSAGQARQLKGAFSLFRRRQVAWRLRRVYWFSIDDEADSCDFCAGSGLFGPDFTPKPAWYAYVRFAGGTAG